MGLLEVTKAKHSKDDTNHKCIMVTCGPWHDKEFCKKDLLQYTMNYYGDKILRCHIGAEIGEWDSGYKHCHITIEFKKRLRPIQFKYIFKNTLPILGPKMRPKQEDLMLVCIFVVTKNLSKVRRRMTIFSSSILKTPPKTRKLTTNFHQIYYHVFTMAQSVSSWQKVKRILPNKALSINDYFSNNGQNPVCPFIGIGKKRTSQK